MTIHTIGDSHSFYGFDTNKTNKSSDIINHHITPATLAYSVGRDKLNRLDIRKFDNIKDNDILIFSFGEIDCRCNIKKHTTEENYKENIDNIVLNYIETIKLNISLLEIKIKKICIYNVVPPPHKNGSLENKDYPFLGTDDERLNYALYFNKKLKEHCEYNNYVFFDVYEKYSDKFGFLIPEYSDGHVHIINSKFINEFIKSNVCN
jgi:hypothetical protein